METIICTHHQPRPSTRDVVVHFRRLNQPEHAHGAARQPVLCVSPTQRVISPPPDQPRTTVSRIQIYGRLVAWVLCVPGTTYYAIEVWDWQAGHVIWVRPNTPRCSIASISFACALCSVTT